ncbi:MAG: VWA domain-containing protein, partial [Dehalococcoidia bacterium]|nr:VWA domain-containing protein [Dehalococcoidia bacterium]
MPSRFRYSMWDGTQEVADLDPDQILDNLSDDLMNFGDLQHALRNLLQRGMRNPMGDRTQGLRDLLQQLRQQRRQQLDRFDLGSIFDQLREQLDEILDMERNTIDQRLEDAGVPPEGQEGQEGQPAEQGDGAQDGEGQQQGAEQGQPSNEGGQQGESQQGQPGEGEQGQQGQQGSQSGGSDGEGSVPTSEFADMLRNIANRKQEFLNELPDDTAGQVRRLQDYEFMDPEAQAKFNELVESLRQAMMNTFFKDLSEQIANMSPEDMERMKQMTQDLNQMLQDKMAGNEPDFDSFMQKYGDLFGDNPPQSLDELIAQMQQQMGQMQSLLGSLPGDMRQQLQD